MTTLASLTPATVGTAAAAALQRHVGRLVVPLAPGVRLTLDPPQGDTDISLTVASLCAWAQTGELGDWTDHEDAADALLTASDALYASPLRPWQGGDLEAGKTYNVALPSGVVSDADPVLQTVARHHPVALTWSQIMTMLGRKARGGHFNTQRKRLLEQGYVTEHNDAVIAADRLWTIVEKPERPADLTEVFRKTLPDPARRIFEYLVQWHGPRCSEEQIGSALSLKPKGGHWNSAMSTLTRANLIFKTNGFIALNHHFLKGGN